MQYDVKRRSSASEVLLIGFDDLSFMGKGIRFLDCLRLKVELWFI